MATKSTNTIVAEEAKSPVCRGHNQLHMCFNCKDDECKGKGFFKMHRCKNLFSWILSLSVLLIVFVGLLATYMIVRICDRNWTDTKLPLSLLIAFTAAAFTVLVIIATIDFKHRTGDAIYE